MKEFLLSPAQAFLFYLSTLALYFLSGGVLLVPVLGPLVGNVVGQIFFFVGLIFVLAQNYQPVLQWKEWQRPSVLSLLFTLITLFAVMLLIDQWMRLQNYFFPLPAKFESQYFELVKTDSVAEFFYKWIPMAYVPAFAEELFFRGVLQKSWVATFGKTKGILLTALSFSLAHLSFPYYMPALFLLGIFLGCLKEWRNCLWLPVLAHLVNNSFALIQSWF